jgi:predicted GNAT superfamily acetyltransferase
MGPADYEISLATDDDIAEILALQEENLPHRGGMLSVRLPAQWFDVALGDMPVVVARKGGALVGYLVASSIASQGHLAVIQGMLRAYAAPPDAYIYGPVCVAAQERGRGVPAALFAAQRAQTGPRPCFTFIRADNTVSLRAHAKLGLCEVARFTHNDAEMVVVAYQG